MRLYSWNVNGIRAVWNKGKLQEFIAQHDPDILCLQETKAQPEQSPVDIEGYEEIWNSAIKKGYSGTAIFSKIKPLSVRYDFPEEISSKYNFQDEFGDPNTEGRVLTAEYEGFYVVTVYTPNSKRGLARLAQRKDQWDPAFAEYLSLLNDTKPVLASGDLNVAHTEIDLARPKDNKKNAGFTEEERAGFTNLLNAGFVDTFRLLYPDMTDAYTWWTAWGNTRDRNIGWRIDYWLASESLAGNIVNAQIHPDVYGSDHCPVSLEINLP